MRILNSSILASILAFSSLPVLAGDITMRGFASFVGGQSLQAEETLYGYEGRFDFRNDSLAAIQFNANLDNKLSATLQLIARGAEGYAANLEWAYLTYEFTDSLQLSAGRIRVPFYRYSDYLDVRYTYPWVKAPQTVYGFEFPGYDGLSLVAKHSFGSWDSTFQAIYGQLKGELAVTEIPIDVENLVGFNWTLNRDWLTLRLGYMTSKSSFYIANFDPILALVNGLGAYTDTSALADAIELKDDNGDFLGFAVGIDYNDWLVDAEYVTYKVRDNLTSKTDAYFVMLGKRIDKFTPYLTYSNSSGKPDDKALAAVPTALANFPISQLGGATLPQFLRGVIAGSETDTDLWMAGLRYDFHPSASLKTELIQQEDIKGEVIELIRIGVDMVF